MVNFDIKKGGKVYMFHKPYIEWLPYMDEPEKFKIGHKILECVDGWYMVYPHKKDSSRWSNMKIKQLLFSKHLA